MDKSKADTTDRPGFRLHRFEALNWGTFDKKIWSLNTLGENSLLTGDIGTGKSTLVDAITTLLVPAGHIVYNKAAGADGKERSLSDYILGLYKKEKDTDDLQAKAVSLRNRDKAITVLLGHFHDDDFSETVCIAQFFWMKEGKSQPERFFLVSSSPLSIEGDLYKPDYDVTALKKMLKARSDIEIFDTYTSYSTEFRRRMAIQSSQALELFYQTVSIKSIGNLTEFVRSHMLEETPVAGRIENLCRNFDNLNRAHEAVIRARQQIDILTPMIEECDVYDKTESEIHSLREARDALYSYMASIEKELCRIRIEHIERDLNGLKVRIEKNRKGSEELESAREKIRRDIDDNGGRRLGELESLKIELADEIKRRKDKQILYENLACKIDITTPQDDRSFYENLSQFQEKIKEADKRLRTIQNEETELQIAFRGYNEKFRSIENELESLRSRPTNIPARNLEIRNSLCNDLGLTEEDVPFAGELIEVRGDDSQWEGALERLLHSFGLSLLVEDQYYTAVSEYVNSTNLRGRLVYYRVKERKDQPARGIEPNHVINKLRIKNDSSLYQWLEAEIINRFDYICCENLEDFRHQPTAVTASGQIKRGGLRHEKDDRYNINDRTRYILGWNNERKISLLEEQQNKISSERDAVLKKIGDISRRLKRINDIRDAARDLCAIQDFWEIDWRSVSLRLEECAGEIREIEESADILRTLRLQLDRVDKDLLKLRNERDDLLHQRGKKESSLEEFNARRENAEKIFLSVDAAERQRIFPRIDAVREEVLKEKKITLEGIGDRQIEMRVRIQKKIDTATDQNRKRDSRISSQMQSFKDIYPVETAEIDASMDASPEYRKILKNLITQDLPRHEERFRRLLREETIQDIALFQNQLERERLGIKEKIDIINSSLEEIEYERGSYIILVPDRTLDAEIRSFQEELKKCMGETLGNEGDEIYTENKFHQVKEIIDRFQGRPGLAELDLKWTAKVTDVRNWFIFSASERWLDDDSEKEFHPDSSGKSGGQKEKMAYTILAAALAYQFSLIKDGLWNRSFRFVMIDEAFGRGSDESARYGLELFKKLKLQILIVTPLQKIHVIEDYVKTVHFVYQENNRSLVGRMTIEEFKENRNKKMADQKLSVNR